MAVGAACAVGVCGVDGCSAVLGIGDWAELVDGGADAGGNDADAELAPDSAALSDGEPPSDSGTGSDSPTCTLPAGGQNGGLLLQVGGGEGDAQAGYQTGMGFGMGYCYAYSDSAQGGASDSFVATSNLCGCGTSGVYGGPTYGGGIGCSLNQGLCDGGICPGAAAIDPAALGIGIHYDLGTLPSTGGSGGVYLTVNDGGDEYDCPIVTATGSCLWPMFIDTITQTTHLKAAPTGATHVNVQVTSGSIVEPWQFCIVSLAFVPSGSSGIGDPCFTDEDCISSACTGGGGAAGWCTKACTPTSECNGNYPDNLNAQGNLNACAASSCAPTCALESDCLSVGADCIGDVCAERSPSAGIGDPCYVDEDCASLLCGGLGFCTKDCSSAADCLGNHSDGLNAQRTANACVTVDSEGDSSCFPECMQPSDCSTFRDSSCDPADGGISVCSL
jgi:hypothetical protein